MSLDKIDNYKYKFTSARFIKTTVLMLLIISVVAVHVSAALNTYKEVKAVKTDNPSGSTLAERYLILGDWPANRQHTLHDFSSNYQITKSAKSAESAENEEVQ